MCQVYTGCPLTTFRDMCVNSDYPEELFMYRKLKSQSVENSECLSLNSTRTLHAEHNS